MGQTMNLNQFNQSPIKGDSATKVNLNTLSVQVDPNSVSTILPGDAVVLTTTTGSGTILVDKATAAQTPLGFVFYSVKKDQFSAGDAMEIGLVGSILFVQANGSVNRGSNLEYVPSAVLLTGPEMKVALGVNPISGLSLSNGADGDIIRMIVIGSAAVSGTFTGGSINNTPIGAATPNTGNFTTVTVSSLTVNGALGNAISVLSTGATISLDPTLGGCFTLTPIQSCTINAASVNAKNQKLVLIITTSGTSTFTITFGTHFKSTGTLATGATSAKVFVVVFEGDGVNYNEASRTTAE